MQKVFLAGANGQLGRALQKIIQPNMDYELTLSDVNVEGMMSLDITNETQVLNLIGKVQPDIIINCAAFTAVDACEQNEDLAYRVNALGPKHLAMGATRVGAKLVHISTDYVFPGDGNKPLSELDTVDPRSAYGRTKLAGEQFVQEACEQYFILRTAWLYGDGKNFVNTMLRLSQTQELVRVVDDQLGSPTSADDLAKAVMALIQTQAYGLYHATSEGICSWADFAEEIFRLTNAKTKVERISSESYKELYPTSADRPKYSVLENAGLKQLGIHFPDWKQAIAAYFEKR